MTPEEIRIAVAQACGWIFKNRSVKRRGGFCELPQCRNLAYRKGRWAPMARLPDYCYDLNACHEMEKTLDDKIRQCSKFADEIMEYPTPRPSRFGAIHSSALQRCEAFLRVKRLWKDAP